MNNDKKITVSKFDASDYLDSDDMLIEYLNSALQTMDSSLVAAALGDMARAKGMTNVAKDSKISRDCLYKSLNDEGNPTMSTFLSVANALNLTLSVEFKENQTTC